MKRPFHNEASQSERRDILKNDRRGLTYSQIAESEGGTARGRYGAISKEQVIGAGPVPLYPPQPPTGPWASEPIGLEPPLGVDLGAAPIVGEAFEVEESLTRLGEARPPRADPNGGEHVRSDSGRLSAVVEPGSPPMRSAAVSDDTAASAVSELSPPGDGGRLSDDGTPSSSSSKRKRK